MRSFGTTISLVLTLTLSVAHAQAPGIALNEAVSSNGSTLAAADGEHYDWIELHNAAEVATPLAGYGLSDRADEPFKWTFPDVQVPAGGYLLVWASGIEGPPPAGELHASFRLSSDGEALVLSDPDGRQVDFVSLPAIPRDMSLGRQPDGVGEWSYFTVPTPLAANEGTTFESVSAPPAFSHPSGMYPGSVTVELTTTEPSGTIYYTLDGSTPTPENVGGRAFEVMTSYPNGELQLRSDRTFPYLGPIEVRPKLDAPNDLATIHTTFQDRRHRPPSDPVLKGTVVRAATFVDGKLASPVVTRTYFAGFDAAVSFDLPILSLASDAAGLFDFYDGIYVGGEAYNTYLTENPDAEGNPSKFPANYAERGRDAERAAHMELLAPDGTSLYSTPLGIRIHGGTTRSRPIKSLRLYARATYGNDRFDYAFFPGSDETGFQTLMLRQSGNDYDSTLFRDAMMQRLMAATELDTQSYLPVAVFLNGEYWGIQNIRERYGATYIAREYDLDEDEIDLLTRRWDVDAGDAAHWRATLDFFEDADLSQPDAYTHAQTLVDVDNLIDYYIAEVYFGNYDWPHNNIDFFRKRTDGYVPDARPGHDGRWRWLLYDTDLGFRYPESPSLHAVADGERRPAFTVVFRSLMRNTEFRARFVARFDEHLRTTFQPDRVLAIIDEMAAGIASEVPRHVDRWSLPRSLEAWEEEVEILRTFAVERPAEIWTQVEAVFPVEAAAFATVR